jgi:hypothetical protein
MMPYIPVSTNSRHMAGSAIHFRTLSNDWLLTTPPPIADLTLRLKPSLFDLKSSAASLLSGSLAFGSKNKN